MTGWVPVTERLPQLTLPVWVSVQREYDSITWMSYRKYGENWYSAHNDEPIRYPILAWQPIRKPEPYQP